MAYSTYGCAPDVENLRDNWREFQDVLDRYGIDRLYHFTDRSNIRSISDSGALLSWRQICSSGVDVPCPGGSDTSHGLDRSLRLDDYVRLSFVSDHPMMHVAKNEGRIDDPVILEISTDVLMSKGVLFTDCNAARTRQGFEKGGDIDFFRSKIHFRTFSRRYFDLDLDERPYYQAEVLVPRSVPLRYVLNREECGIYVSPEKLRPVRMRDEKEEQLSRALVGQLTLMKAAREWVDGNIGFKADRAAVHSGGKDEVVLSWNKIPTEYRGIVNSLTVNGVDCKGKDSITVRPTETTSYRLAVSVGGKIVGKFVTVRMVGAVTSEFKSDFEYVIPGGSVTLSWDVKNAASVELVGYGKVSACGSKKVPVRAASLFTLRITDEFGESSRSFVTVCVSPEPLIKKVVVPQPVECDNTGEAGKTSPLRPLAPNLKRVSFGKGLLRKAKPVRMDGLGVSGPGRSIRRVGRSLISSFENILRKIKQLISK